MRKKIERKVRRDGKRLKAARETDGRERGEEVGLQGGIGEGRGKNKGRREGVMHKDGRT